jgi:hypothetical protein
MITHIAIIHIAESKLCKLIEAIQLGRVYFTEYIELIVPDISDDWYNLWTILARPHRHTSK